MRGAYDRGGITSTGLREASAEPGKSEPNEQAAHHCHSMSGPGARRGRKPRPGHGEPSSPTPASPVEDPLVVLQSSLPPGILPSQLQCPICRELLNDPRDLPCGHSACFLCLGGTVSKSNQTQCRACRATHTVRTSYIDQFCDILQLGGLGAFALPVSRLAALSQQLRSDARCIRAIKSLPQVAPAPLVPMTPTPAPQTPFLPSMAAGGSIFDAPATPFAVGSQPQPVSSGGDKYADFRALVETTQASFVPSYNPPSSIPLTPQPAAASLPSFSFLEPMAAPTPTPAPTLTPTPAVLPAPILPTVASAQPRPAPAPASALTPAPAPAPSVPAPSPIPLKPSLAPPSSTVPVQTPTSTPSVAVTPAPLKPAASAPVAIAPRIDIPATPAAAAAAAATPNSPQGESSFFARAAALFGSLSVTEMTPAPAVAPAPRADGKPIAAPPARAFPPELLASLSDAEKAKLGITSSPAAPAAPAAPTNVIVQDNFMVTPPSPVQSPGYKPGADFASLGDDDMFAGLSSAGAEPAPTSPPPTAAIGGLKEPLSRAEYARQKREALKKKKYEEAEQNSLVRKREAELEAQQRWEMQRTVEAQQSSVMHGKLAELQEKTRREAAEREARLKRQKELREEHRKTLLANDPAAAPGASTASIPDANTPLNYAEFNVKEDNLRNLFNAWARDLWFAPDDLLAKAIFGPIQAAYCPFYLFDAKTTSQYTGQLCKSTEQVGPTGERKMVDTWIPISGTYKGSYPMGEDAKYLCALKNWDINKVYYEADGGPRPAASTDTFASKFFKAVVDSIPKIRPLREQLLPAEAWQIVWHEYEEAFVRPVEDRQCSAKVLAEERGKGVSAVKVTTTYDVTRKLVYFPVYLCSFVYDNKSYRFMVHGQNSSVEADRPYGLGVVSSTAKQGFEAIAGLFKR